VNSQQAKKHREELHLEEVSLFEYLQLNKSLEISSGAINFAIVSRFSNDILEKVLAVDFASHEMPTLFSSESFENLEVQIVNLRNSSSRLQVLVILSDQDLCNSSSVPLPDIQLRIKELSVLFQNSPNLNFIITPVLVTGPVKNSAFWEEVNSFIEDHLALSPQVTYLKSLESRWKNPGAVVEYGSYLTQTQPLTISGMRALSLLTLIEVSKQTTPGAKLILLDADNTLWAGVLGELGTLGVTEQFLDSDCRFTSLHQQLIKLHLEGVLLAILSKNNFQDIADLFRSDSKMPLKFDHFSHISANWEDKWINAHKIAKDLNLGLSSFVFLDDNPVERQLMRERAPEIFTPEPSLDGTFIGLIETLIPITARRRSVEDVNRATYYRQSLEVQDEEKKFTDRISFLSSLNMKAKVTSNSNLDKDRALQLIQKTNQFNMTGLRLDSFQLETLLSSLKFLFFQVSLSDKFGENGNVLLACFELKENGHSDIVLFNMSCRTIGRNLEYEFLHWATKKLISSFGVKTLGVKVNRTSRNETFVGFFSSAGFEELGDDFYTINLTNTKISAASQTIKISEE
jgi:FkbH-like protein